MAGAFVAALAMGGGAWSLAPEPAARPTPRDDAYSLVVDLSERTLYVMRNGEASASYPVAIGQPGHATPTGEYRIRRIVWNPRWVPPDARWARNKRPREAGDPRNPMGRVKMFFHEPDLYIHGTNDEASLGAAESHGCVRMRNEDVIGLARQVMEHGGEARSPSWFRGVIDRVTATRQVSLSQPVKVTVRH